MYLQQFKGVISQEQPSRFLVVKCLYIVISVLIFEGHQLKLVIFSFSHEVLLKMGL